MSRVTAYPYARADGSRVDASPWQYVHRANLVELPDAFPRWDYATPIALRRRLVVDLAGVLTDCQLGSGAVVGATAIWRSSSTGLRGASTPLRLALDAVTVDVALELDAGALGGLLTLHTNLVLLEPGRRKHPLAASRPGSILWRDRTTVLLEGEAARFPVALVDFERFPLATPRGAWYLDVRRGALDHSTMGSLCLYINTAHPAVVRATQDPDADAEARAIVSALRHDVTRALVNLAIDDDDFRRAPEVYPDGTLGATLRRLLQIVAPGETPESLHALRERGTGEYECMLQARAGLFRS